MSNAEQSLFQLSEEENQAIFEHIILPDLLALTSPPSEIAEKVRLVEGEGLVISNYKPKAIFLGGQSGSGKSSLARFHNRQLRNAGGAVIVNSDALREYHPYFAHLQQTQFEKASFLVNPDTVKWQQKLIEAASASGRNLILDGTLGGDPASIQQTIQRLRGQGYTIQLSILAVPALLSRLGIYQRYEDQLRDKGTGRWVGMTTHDRLYTQIPQTLTRLEQAKAVDRIQIYGRPTTIGLNLPLLYDNWLEQGEWVNPPDAARALEESRNRPWNTVEKNAYQKTLQAVKAQMTNRGATAEHRAALDNQTDLLPLIHRPAQPADAQLYFDWANDPLTRQQSFNTNPIVWENHLAWFARKLTDPNALLLVFETQQGQPVGQVRFERTPDEVVIGVSLDAAFRGQGLAPVMLRAAVAAYRAQYPLPDLPIHAYIRPENGASRKSFERAGFRFSHESGKFGVQSVVYTVVNEQ